MQVLGYIRVSSDQQDLSKQKHLLLQYSQEKQLLISNFIEAEVSSTRNMKERKIDELLSKLEKEDILLVAELSRLGRNMLETLQIITKLNEKGIRIIFVRQPELSTEGNHSKLLLAIYSYFAEAERDYIALRTKQGLAAAKAQGKLLGRPKGSKNKKGRMLDPFKKSIAEYLQLGLPMGSISKIINNQLDSSLSYNSYKYYINNDKDLSYFLKQKNAKANPS